MLGVGHYLLGVAELVVLAGFATLGANRALARLLPTFEGPPAWLATAVVALAILIWVAELLGTFGAFEALPFLLCVVVVGLATWALLPRVASGVGWTRPKAVEGKARALGPKPSQRPEQRVGRVQATPDDRTRGPSVDVPTLIALAIAVAAVVHFAAGVRLRLSTGMTGFDSTWYHGPFAVGFFQSGDTWSLHFIAPQFLAWFYPANSEIFHAIGMLAFGRDILSPLLNLGWFVGCLFAVWCIGRPFKVAPVSLTLGAIALSVPALADQAGEARNDIVGLFFLLAAVAVAVNAWEARSDRVLPTGALIVVGLAVGLAAGTKLNFLLPAAALVVGLVAIAPKGGRWRALAASGLPALAGGGYWYLRNLVHTGNPLPWVHRLGPFSLPAPGQGLGGRETHSVFGYLTDSSIWSGWFLPGLHHGLGLLWPLLGALALFGLLLCLGRGASPLLRVVGLTGLAVVAAWLLAPTSASGPAGMPRGFESGLRYLAPALILGLALLPVTPPLRNRLQSWVGGGQSKTPRASDVSHGPAIGLPPRGILAAATAFVLLVGIAAGYPIQRHYLENRYANPQFTTPGLNAAFKWSSAISNARIATTSTRQYPLYGTDLSNQVQYVGLPTPHGGFIAPPTCRTWRRLLNAGHYDYVVASRDRIEPHKPTYPSTAHWTEGPSTTVVLRKPPTVVFRLTGPLDPAACP
ncbi:MAG TPA: hypothetical protein VNY83_06365 [Solirubrobacterales bacterium]|jgi:hypothetical protein|nr:hypothetical protein [Solirubrobacterales bacterium]